MRQLGHITATSLTAGDVSIAGGEWKKLVSAKTVNKVFATLNAAFKFARSLGIKINPMIDVKKLKDRATPGEMEFETLGGIPDHGADEPEAKANVLRAIGADEVYSAVELGKIIEASEPGLERALLMTAILLGPRHGELNAIHWSVLDLKKQTLVINRSLTELKGGSVLEAPKTKNGYRRLKLAPALVNELRRWKLACPPSPNGFVFVDPLGRPLNRKANSRILKAVCERAGVRALAMNNLRHSFASQHLVAGTPPLEVSRMMGHSDPSVTLKVYSRWAEREQSTSEIALAERIFRAADQEGNMEAVRR